MNNWDILEKIKMLKGIRFKVLPLVALMVVGIVVGIVGYRQFSNASLREEIENLQAELTIANENWAKAESELEDSEKQVKLLEDTTAALRRQVKDLDKVKASLEKELEDAFKIIDAKPVITRNQLEEQLTTIGELATIRYFYTNATRREASKTWLWGWTLPFSDSSLLAAYDGTIKVGIDLKEVKFNISGKKITVTLPHSTILDNYIPQETINVLEVKDGLFNPVTFDDYNQFIAEEREAMGEKAIDRGLITDADNEAELIIKAFLKNIPGIDAYNIEFKYAD